MSLASVSLAQSPPLSVPARFFVTAPLFGVLAAVVMMWDGAAGLSDRWSPTLLAATHLLTLGYMAMIMLGALTQVFPVVIGHPFRHALLVSTVVHVCLTFGVVLLSAGFLTSLNALMPAAVILLALAVVVFCMAAAVTLSSVEAWGDTTRAIVLALAAFAVTTGFGLWLGLGYTEYLPLPRLWTDIHAGWGLAGWVPLLLMGVAYQVVPMFQLTREYPRKLRRAFPVVLFSMLLVSTLAHWLAASEWLVRSPQVIAGLTLVGFAVATLDLQRRRRRKRPDVTVAYWRVGLSCLVLAVLTWLAGLFPAYHSGDARFALVLGVLMIPGFALCVINGMLYKIVPFLVWLHLAMAPATETKPTSGRVPGMKQIIPDKRSWWQWRIHTTALVLILAGILGVPGLLFAGVLVFALACIWLSLDMFSALRRYRVMVDASQSKKETAIPGSARI